MNLNPNQPDLPEDISPIDESLLNEALAEPTPVELEAKILELTDPQMLSLLDEAMAPEAVPAGLNDRILAATVAATVAVNTAEVSQGESPAVVARIGPMTLRYAAAAAIALAVGLGVWVANQEASDVNMPITGTIDTPGVTPDETIVDASDPDWLNTEIASVDTEFFDSGLDAVADSLEDVSISRDTLWSELDAYEQFLTDIESDDV
ncbi:MAG: hypothetical protein AB8C95_13635 [Phycisphaeraceae bacterium]